MRTGPKLGVEAGNFLVKKKLESRKLNLRKICFIEIANNYIVYNFYEIFDIGPNFVLEFFSLKFLVFSP